MLMLLHLHAMQPHKNHSCAPQHKTRIKPKTILYDLVVSAAVRKLLYIYAILCLHLNFKIINKIKQK